MIYLDSSVVLAHFLVETQRLPDRVWEQQLTSSRLLEYEVWTRLHLKDLSTKLRPVVLSLFSKIAFVELTENVLARRSSRFQSRCGLWTGFISQQQIFYAQTATLLNSRPSTRACARPHARWASLLTRRDRYAAFFAYTCCSRYRAKPSAVAAMRAYSARCAPSAG